MVGIVERVSALDNNYFEACWDLELQDENMFCYGAVNWKIDEDTYYNQVRQDEAAKAMYRNLLFKWSNRTRPETEKPQSHCLAISRDVFCAYQFRRCRDYEAPKQPVCDWMCALFINRCDEETELIQQICGGEEEGRTSKSCSSAVTRFGQRINL